MRVPLAIVPTTRRVALLVTTLSVLAVESLGGQTMPSTNPDRPNCRSDGVDPVTFKTVVNKQFSALVSPASEGIPGSFLAVEIKEAQASAAETFISNAGFAVTVSARGGVTDGVVALLKDATVTPTFGASAQLHFLTPAKRALQYTLASCDTVELSVRTAEATHALRMAEIEAGGSAVQRRLDRAALALKAAKIDSVLGTIPNSTQSAVDILRRDSLTLERARVTSRLLWQDSIPARDPETQMLVANNDLGKAYDAARKLLDVRGYAFSWWSLGVALDNTSFKLFDPAAALEAQLSKKTYLTRALTLTYSRIRRSEFTHESRYLAIDARVGWTDNIADLSKVEITDRQQITPPPAERVTEKKTTAYRGAYQDDIASVRLGASYYEFLLPDDRLAFHVFPALTAKAHQVGELALGFGLLLSARDAAKKASVINAEVFFNTPDVGNSRKSNQGFWNRSVLGLQLTFPIKFGPRS
jgi:hypothetical protein